MKARKLTSFITFALLIFISCKEKSQVSSSGVETQQAAQEVSISIDADWRVFVDGEVVALENLERKLSEKLADDKAEFVITVMPHRLSSIRLLEWLSCKR